MQDVQELATREHMLDHGQLGPATPAGSPVGSRRPSSSSQTVSVPRCPGETAPRRPSRLSFSSKFGESLSMSSIEPTTTVQSAHPIHTLRSMSRTSIDSSSALDIEDESDTESNIFPADSSSTEPDLSELTKEDASIDAAHILCLQLSDTVLTDGKVQSEAQSKGTGGASLPVEHFIRPSELSLHLFANPTLASLRSANSPISPSLVNSPPILLNTKCSGYFVEPMKWMEHFLSGGQLAGKIICPNKKCAAKLGNYDWAGVCCGCKQWVTPGFCINRSKVDEVI